MDTIHIRDLRVACVIGVFDKERSATQDVVIDLAVFTDLRKAGHSDNIRDTINYKDLKDELVRFVSGSRFLLIEALAESIAAISLKREGVEGVRVHVRKPAALGTVADVAVEIERMREDMPVDSRA